MISLCKMFSGSACSKQIECLNNEVLRLEVDVSAYKCSLDSQLGIIQEQKAVFDYRIVALEKEKEELEATIKVHEGNAMDYTAQINHLEDQVNDMEEELETAQNQIEKLNSKLLQKIKTTKKKAL